MVSLTEEAGLVAEARECAEAWAHVPLGEFLNALADRIEALEAENNRLRSPVDWDALEQERVRRGLAAFIEEKRLNP